MQMELDKHIILNTNNVRIDAFMVLYRYISDNNDFDFQVQKILNNKKAEELFLHWYNIEF